MIWRNDLFAVDGEKNIARPYSGLRSSTAVVNVLENPAGSAHSLTFKVGCAERGPTGSSARALMEKADVRCLQTLKKKGDCPFELFRRCSFFDQRLVLGHSELPFIVEELR